MLVVGSEIIKTRATPKAASAVNPQTSENNINNRTVMSKSVLVSPNQQKPK